MTALLCHSHPRARLIAEEIAMRMIRKLARGRPESRPDYSPLGNTWGDFSFSIHFTPFTQCIFKEAETKPRAFWCEKTKIIFEYLRAEHRREPPARGDRGARHFEPHQQLVPFSDLWSDCAPLAWCLEKLQLTDQQVWSDSWLDETDGDERDFVFCLFWCA